jgi:hypothetical protein
LDSRKILTSSINILGDVPHDNQSFAAIPAAALIGVDCPTKLFSQAEYFQVTELFSDRGGF